MTDYIASDRGTDGSDLYVQEINVNSLLDFEDHLENSAKAALHVFRFY